jgi:hypothetical protein
MRRVIKAICLLVLGGVVALGCLAAFNQVQDAKAEREMRAQLLRIAPARELIVQRGEMLVHGSATEKSTFGRDSEVHYLAVASVRYLVDLRDQGGDDLRYDDSRDVLRVTIPDVRADTSVNLANKKRIAYLGLLATEGGTGNKLETDAENDLKRQADREANRAANMNAARKAARFEIKELYEKSMRARGQLTQVEVIIANSP